MQRAFDYRGPRRADRDRGRDEGAKSRRAIVGLGAPASAWAVLQVSSGQHARAAVAPSNATTTDRFLSFDELEPNFQQTPRRQEQSLLIAHALAKTLAHSVH